MLLTKILLFSATQKQDQTLQNKRFQFNEIKSKEQERYQN